VCTHKCRHVYTYNDNSILGGEGCGIYSIIWEIKYWKNDCNNVRRIGGRYKIYAHIIILYIYTYGTRFKISPGHKLILLLFRGGGERDHGPELIPRDVQSDSPSELKPFFYY